METKPPIPLAILVGIQTPEVDDVAHAASLEELGRLVKTLGYEVVGTVSQRREGTGAGTLLGKRQAGGTGGAHRRHRRRRIDGAAPKSKARERFEGAAEAAAHGRARCATPPASPSS